MGLGIKTRIKRAIGSMGYEVLRKDRLIERFPQTDSRLLDVYIRPALAAGRKLKFVQVGANDGVTEDPLVDILSLFDVQAVLIEPQPEAGTLLKERYATNENVRVEVAAISDQPGELDFYVAARSEDGEIADSRISSFSREHVAQHISNRKDVQPEIFGANPVVKTLRVEVITIAQAIERAGWNSADVLIIDAEGFDEVIVRSVLDARLNFGLIYFEHANMSLETYRNLTKRLVADGYATSMSGKDTVAVLPEFLDSFAYPAAKTAS